LRCLPKLDEKGKRKDDRRKRREGQNGSFSFGRDRGHDEWGREIEAAYYCCCDLVEHLRKGRKRKEKKGKGPSISASLAIRLNVLISGVAEERKKGEREGGRRGGRPVLDSLANRRHERSEGGNAIQKKRRGACPQTAGHLRRRWAISPPTGSPGKRRKSRESEHGRDQVVGPNCRKRGGKKGWEKKKGEKVANVAV